VRRNDDDQSKNAHNKKEIKVLDTNPLINERSVVKCRRY